MHAIAVPCKTTEKKNSTYLLNNSDLLIVFFATFNCIWAYKGKYEKKIHPRVNFYTQGNIFYDKKFFFDLAGAESNATLGQIVRSDLYGYFVTS